MTGIVSMPVSPFACLGPTSISTRDLWELTDVPPLVHPHFDSQSPATLDYVIESRPPYEPERQRHDFCLALRRQSWPLGRRIRCPVTLAVV